MRVIAGRLGARQFEAPKTKRTHPMGERVKGALFNSLGDIEGLKVLDGFAGSGALSFEAISRGASQAIAIEVDHQAQQIIAKNIADLGITDKVHLIKASVQAWLATSQEQFDIVLCDPPYDAVEFELLERLAYRARSEGIVVLSLPPKFSYTLPGASFSSVLTKNYGDASLYFYRRKV